MFGLSKGEKYRRQFNSVLSNFLVMYPGGIDALFKAYPGFKTQEFNQEWRPAKHALVVAREVLTRAIDQMQPDERVKVGRQLNSLDMKVMRQWTLQAIGKNISGGFPGLHHATVYIAAAECVADLFHVADQYDQFDRQEFSLQIDQAIAGMSKQERDFDRIDRAIEPLSANDDD